MMQDEPCSTAIYQACCTVKRHTGQPPTAIRLSEAMLTAWNDEVLRVHPLLLTASAYQAWVARFCGINIYPDATIPPGQIDVIDYRGGRVFVRVPYE